MQNTEIVQRLKELAIVPIVRTTSAESAIRAVEAISEGGTNAKKNLRAIPKAKNESFNRAGPGGKQIGKA